MTRTALSLSQLTLKQRDVLALVADNRTSKEIAARLGISESAVNQRIEMVRARLGGLPRGELARLYRQEFGEEATDFIADSGTWQKIHLPEFGDGDKGGAAGSISMSEAGHGDGSQLTALLFRQDDTWLWREDRATAIVRSTAIAAIVVAAMVIAIAVTQVLGPVGG